MIDYKKVQSFEDLCCLCVLRKENLSCFIGSSEMLWKDIRSQYHKQIEQARCVGGQVKFLHKYNGDLALLHVTISHAKFNLNISVRLLKRGEVLYVPIEEFNKLSTLPIL